MKRKLHFEAFETVVFGKMDYYYKPFGQDAVKVVEAFKTTGGMRITKGSKAGQDKSTLSKTNLVELCNLLASEGIEADIVVSTVKKLTHTRELFDGDNIMSTKRPQHTGLFDL